MFTIEKHGKEKLKKSVFGHFFQRDESCCAYNALKIIAIYFEVILYPYILRTTEVPTTKVLEEIPENLLKQLKH